MCVKIPEQQTCQFSRIKIVWITGIQEFDIPQYLDYSGFRGDSPGNDIASVSTQTMYLVIIYSILDNCFETLEKCGLNWLLLLFWISQIWHPKNVQTGVTVENKGFAVVLPGFIPSVHRCWLKNSLTYPPSHPNREGLRTYYKLDGRFNIN